MSRGGSKGLLRLREKVIYSDLDGLNNTSQVLDQVMIFVRSVFKTVEA